MPEIVPSKYGEGSKVTDPAVQEKFLTAIRRGASYSAASRSIGIEDKTFFGWKRHARQGTEPYASFIARVEEAEAELEQRLTDQWLGIIERAVDDHRPVMEFLGRRFKADWSPTYKQEIEATIGYTSIDAQDVLRRLFGDAPDEPTGAEAEGAGGGAGEAV
jgi:hypothetical protein